MTMVFLGGYYYFTHGCSLQIEITELAAITRCSK